MKRYKESELRRICMPTLAERKAIEAKRIEVNNYVRLHLREPQRYLDWEEVENPLLVDSPFRAAWCLHCERVYPAKLWRDLDFDCPGIGCNGGALDMHPLRSDFIFGEYLPLYPSKHEIGFFDKCGEEEKSYWSSPKKS